MNRKPLLLAGPGLLFLILLLTGGVLQAQQTPDTPENLRIAIENGEVVARWDAVDDAATYRLLLIMPVAQNGSTEVHLLVVQGNGTPPTSIAIPDNFLVPGITVRLRLTAVSSGDVSSTAATLSFDPRAFLNRLASSGTYKGRDRHSNGHNGIPIGAMGWIFRMDDALTVYAAVSPSAGALALRLTQSELDALIHPATEAAAVKTSEDRRVAVSLRPDRNLVISMGPNPEGKILHTVLLGGLFGPVISTYTTYGTQPPGEGWQVLPRLA